MLCCKSFCIRYKTCCNCRRNRYIRFRNRFRMWLSSHNIRSRYRRWNCRIPYTPGILNTRCGNRRSWNTRYSPLSKYGYNRFHSLRYRHPHKLYRMCLGILYNPRRISLDTNRRSPLNILSRNQSYTESCKNRMMTLFRCCYCSRSRCTPGIPYMNRYNRHRRWSTFQNTVLYKPHGRMTCSRSSSPSRKQ